MNAKISLMTMTLLGSLFMVATPAEAHVEYTEVRTITGTVVGTHYLQVADVILPNLPDEVSFTQKTTIVRDCGDGTVKSSVTTLEYAGSQIAGEGGIYTYLAQYFIGGAGANAARMGATTVWFAVSGQNALGWQHSFSGTGLGTHTVNYYNNRLCAPPADGPDSALDIGELTDPLIGDGGGDKDPELNKRLREFLVQVGWGGSLPDIDDDGDRYLVITKVLRKFLTQDDPGLADLFEGGEEVEPVYLDGIKLEPRKDHNE